MSNVQHKVIELTSEVIQDSKNVTEEKEQKEVVHVSEELGFEFEESSALVSEEPNAAESWQKSLARRPSRKNERTGLLELHSYSKFKLQDFQQFGVGIYLYFRFLNQLFRLFLIMFIVTLPLVLSSLASQKIERTQYAFEQTTIGNLGAADEYDSIEYPQSVNMAQIPLISNFVHDNYIYKEDAAVLFAWSDLFCTIVFLIFLIRVKATQFKVAQIADDNVTTVADYSVKVTGLPKQFYNREELQAFFESRWGKVVDVAICYNDTGIITKYVDKSEIVGQKLSAAKRDKQNQVKSLDKKFNKMSKTLRKTKKKYSKRTVCAYVTFNDAKDCANCLVDNPNTMLSKLCMPSHLKLRGKYKLHVQKAPEPSEIIYENMKYSKLNVCIRRSITFVLAFITILVSCGITLAAAVYRKKNLESASSDGTSNECTQTLSTHTSDDLINNVENLDDNEISCLCSKLSLTEMSDYSSACSDYIQNLLVSNVLMFVSSIIIVIINIALKFVSRMLVNFEKHTSVTKMERELTWKMFAGLFFNTAIVLLIVNANTKSQLGFSLIDGDYSDFVPEWYSIVGTSLLLTMILNTINPHAIPVILYPITKLCVWRKRKNVAIQREMDKLNEGENFILAERYAAILNTVWVAFFYSSGIPVLLLIASLTFFVTYCCDKFTLLKRCQLPPKYNIDIAQFTLTLLRPVVYIHLAVSVWVFGSETVLLHHDVNVSEIPDDSSRFRRAFEGTVMNYNAFPSFLALAILLTYDIVLNILTTFRLKQLFCAVSRRLLRFICFCIKKNSSVHVQEDIGLFLEELEQGNVFESYLLSHQVIYNVAFLKGSGMFKEIPLYKKQKMQQRIKQQSSSNISVV